MHLVIAVVVEVPRCAGATRGAAVVAPASALDCKAGGPGPGRAGAAGEGVRGRGLEGERVALRVGGQREARGAAREGAGLLPGLHASLRHATS